MYDKAEGNQLIVVMPDKEVLFNERYNGIYYCDLEDCYLVLVNTLEENREGFSRRELSGAIDYRQSLAMFG